jgi:hypothetical protein
MSALVRALEEVETTAAHLEKVEQEANRAVEEARAPFVAALVKAHKEGATFTQLAQVSGFSRSRVAQLVGGGD